MHATDPSPIATVRGQPLRAGRMSGGDALVASLRRWAIDTVFGLPGVQLDDLFDALQRQSDTVRVIHTRHEQGAAYMALGSALATGKPAVFAVVPGPGVLNATAALATAYACNARVLCLTSTVPSALIDREYGALHEIRDQLGILGRLTKWSARATHAGEIPALVDEAFRQLLTGRPRPVALEVPPDVLSQRTLVSFAADKPALLQPTLDPEAVSAAARLIHESREPLIVVGSGALHANEEVRQLAHLLQAPVVSRQLGRGVLSDRDELAIPAAIGNDLWKEADLVIGIGTRLQQLREWGQDPRLKVVRIDVDPAEINRLTSPDAAILADAAAATAALITALRQQGEVGRLSRTESLRALKQSFRASIAATIQPQIAYLDAIRSALPDDGIFVDEMTQVGYAARYALPVYQPRAFISSGYQCTLGYGFATALGAQVAVGRRRVVSVTGDGGFLYNVQELATAVLQRIPLVTIVFNDGNFGNVRRIQQNKFQGRVFASQLHNPDFRRLAEDFGAVGLRAATPDELLQVLRGALATDQPTLIEVPMDIDAVASPWKYVHSRRVRP